jgi:hypothetical protein
LFALEKREIFLNTCVAGKQVTLLSQHYFVGGQNSWQVV